MVNKLFGPITLIEQSLSDFIYDLSCGEALLQQSGPMCRSGEKHLFLMAVPNLGQEVMSSNLNNNRGQGQLSPVQKYSPK